MKRPLLLLSVTLTAALGCAESSIGLDRGQRTAAVVGGAADTLVGATVALSDAGDPFCTGTLIAPRVVLTAAHCAVEYDDQGYPTNTPMDPAGVVIAFDLLNAIGAPAASTVAVDEVIPHPDYRDEDWDLGTARDVALMVLSTDAPVVPAPLLTEAELDALLVPGAPVVLSGYGVTDLQDENAYGVLFSGDSTFVERAGFEFVAGDGQNADTCYGDSGGPVYVEVDGVRHVVGVTSRGAGEGDCGTGGIYGLVNAYTPWIEEVTDGLFPGDGVEVEAPDVDDDPGAGDDAAPDEETDTEDDLPAEEPDPEADPADAPDAPDAPKAPEDDEGVDVGGATVNPASTIIIEQGCSAGGVGSGLWAALVLLGLGRRRR